METSKNKCYRVDFFANSFNRYASGTVYADNHKQALEKVAKRNGYTRYDVEEWDSNSVTNGFAQVFYNHRLPNQFLVQVLCLDRRSEQIPKVYCVQVNNFKYY